MCNNFSRNMVGGMTIDFIGMSGIDHALCTVLKTHKQYYYYYLSLFLYWEFWVFSLGNILLPVELASLNARTPRTNISQPVLAADMTNSMFGYSKTRGECLQLLTQQPPCLFPLVAPRLLSLLWCSLPTQPQRAADLPQGYPMWNDTLIQHIMLLVCPLTFLKNTPAAKKKSLLHNLKVINNSKIKT